ncbi:MAG: rod shape-determining protein MreC [Lachnospiraceae bacterium]|nr:rod shape-determining protein MreC [Lachnospiraceae bacterium]
MAKLHLKRKRFVIPDRYVLLIVTAVCIILMYLTYFTDAVSTPLSYVAAYTIVPFEKGLNTVGRRIEDKLEQLKDINDVMEKNEALQAEVDRLTIENNQLSEDRYELSELRSLYQLDDKFSAYDKVGARVIGKDTGNWFSTFTIDKGKNDGIEVNMNVISGSGLVGIVTEVGPNWASVRSCIDDSSNISGMVLSTSDTLMVSGDLKLMENGDIRFSQLTDDGDKVGVGDEIVTSNVSNKFLPGITIGYISSIETDANNLTKSGSLTPTVDFRHINTVLVIKELKQSKKSE